MNFHELLPNVWCNYQSNFLQNRGGHFTKECVIPLLWKHCHQSLFLNRGTTPAKPELLKSCSLTSPFCSCSLDNIEKMYNLQLHESKYSFLLYPSQPITHLKAPSQRSIKLLLVHTKSTTLKAHALKIWRCNISPKTSSAFFRVYLENYYTSSWTQTLYGSELCWWCDSLRVRLSLSTQCGHFIWTHANTDYSKWIYCKFPSLF